jgi:CHAT domain-containing protein
VTAISQAQDLVEALLRIDDESERRSRIQSVGLSETEFHDAVSRLVANPGGAAYRYFGSDPRRMESICRDAILLAERSEDLYLRALTRMAYGDSLRAQDRSSEAQSCFDEAARGFAALNRPIEAARTRIGWAWVTAKLGDTEAAEAALRSARRVLSAHGEVLRVANLDLSRGFVSAQQGLYRQALRQFTSAQRLFRSLEERGAEGEATATLNRGVVLIRLGRHDEAAAALDQARELRRSQGNSTEVARATRLIGEHLRDTGHYAAALRSFEAAQDLFRAAGMNETAASIGEYTADCYLRLGRPVEALATLDAARDQLPEADFVPHATGMAACRVVAYLLLGQEDAALAVLEETGRRYPATPQQSAWLNVQRAGLLIEDRAPAEALEAARIAYGAAVAAGARPIQIDALAIQARVHLAQGDLPEARRCLRAARRLVRTMDSPAILYRLNEMEGQLAEAARRKAVAVRHYRDAIACLERERPNVIFEFRDSHAAGRSASFERLALLQVQAGQTKEAFETVERAKSRAIADVIAGKVDLQPRGAAGTRRLARELLRARQDYAAVSAHLSRAEDHSEADRRLHQDRLSALEARISALLQRLQIASAADGLLDEPGLPASPSLPQLPPGAGLVEYFYGAEKVIRFVLTNAKFTVQILPVSVPELERELRALLLNLHSAPDASPEQRERLSGQARRRLQRLYEILLGNCAELEALSGLVIIPHGLLHYLPFGALHDGHRFLIERLEIASAPSATLYDVLEGRKARSRKALILGDTRNGALPFAASEAIAVGRVLGQPAYTEAAATRALLRKASRTTGLVHIAAHGEFRADAPLFSHVELADGPLTSADVFGLNLKSAFITLSACETGRALLGGGDELVGLARAFIYAGASGMLVSHWRVEDESTALLMQDFYASLRDGATPAAALRRAQVARIQTPMPQKGDDHPFLWASFQLIGGTGPLWPLPERSSG